jgi:hypothetical protein
MSNDTISTASKQDIAVGLFGPIQWEGETAYLHCPGEAQHTHPTGERDCRVTLDNVPTIHCFHTSCMGQVEAANHALRSAIAKGAMTGSFSEKPQQRSTEEIAASKERERYQALKLRAKASMTEILDKHSLGAADLWEKSPVRLTCDPAKDWRLLLKLFQPDDVVWIGGTTDSCQNDAPEPRKAECRRHFRAVADWLPLPAAPSQFICPNPFKCGINSRSNQNVLFRRYLVVESDTLTKDQIGAVFSWCQQFMRLRAVVDTAGKSLHGWFDAPGTAAEKELKAILPELGCDPSLFKLAQPCRLPGARRGDKLQSLLYLDLEGLQ